MAKYNRSSDAGRCAHSAVSSAAAKRERASSRHPETGLPTWFCNIHSHSAKLRDERDGVVRRPPLCVCARSRVYVCGCVDVGVGVDVDVRVCLLLGCDDASGRAAPVVASASGGAARRAAQSLRSVSARARAFRAANMTIRAPIMTRPPLLPETTRRRSSTCL